MLKKWRNLSFATKLIFVFGISVALVIILITYTQIDMFVTMSEEESVNNLNMLTDQVALNFSENQDTIAKTVYARATTFTVPTLMHEYNLTDGDNRVELQYALAQMVTNSTDYDYVMIETKNGERLDTGSKYSIDVADLNILYDDCVMLLENYADNTHGSNNWYRCSGGEVYILKDVYAISPLRYVGRMVVHMRKEPFKISDYYSDTGFLFFDKNNEYLTSAGMEIPEGVEDAVKNYLEEGVLYSSNNWYGQEYFLAKKSNDGWTIVGISSMNKFYQMKNTIIRNGILYGIFALCVGTSLVMLLLASFVKKLRILKESMNEVAKGNLDYQVSVQGEDDISQLSNTFNYMTNRISELLAELIDKERAKKDVEFEMLEYNYRSLETQIRPHFIYNALESINSMAKMNNNTKIVEALQKISRYFRNISVNTTKQFITAEQEFNSLRDYTEIYGFIHGNKLEVTYLVKDKAKNAMIPTMILQPIVENALQHGIKSKGEKSEIRIHAYEEDNKLIITVKDNGEGLSKEVEQIFRENGYIPSREHGGIGIANVRERLDLIYGDEAGMIIQNREEGGLIVKIVLPFNYNEPELGKSDVLAELDEVEDWSN